MALGRRGRNALTDTLRLIGDLTPAANLTIYFPNATSAATTTLTAYARTLIASVDDAAARVIMKLGPDDAVEFDSLELSSGLELNGSKVTGLGAPTDNGDATSKLYVDTGLSDLRSYVDDQDAALRDYVDDQDAADRAYTDQEIDALRDYVDTQDEADRAYTDQKVDDLRDYVDAQDAAIYAYIDSGGGGGGGSTGYDFFQSFAISTTTNTLTLSENILATAVSHQVVLNGRIMLLGASSDYTIAAGGGSVTFNYSLEATDAVAVYGKKVTA